MMRALNNIMTTLNTMHKQEQLQQLPLRLSHQEVMEEVCSFIFFI